MKKLRKKGFWWGFALGQIYAAMMLGLSAFSKEAVQKFLTRETWEQVVFIMFLFMLSGALWGGLSLAMESLDL